MPRGKRSDGNSIGARSGVETTAEPRPARTKNLPARLRDKGFNPKAGLSPAAERWIEEARALVAEYEELDGFLLPSQESEVPLRERLLYCLRRALDRPVSPAVSSYRRSQALADVLVRRALTGDLQAIAMVMDRVSGPVVQKTESVQTRVEVHPEQAERIAAEYLKSRRGES